MKMRSAVQVAMAFVFTSLLSTALFGDSLGSQMATGNSLGCQPLSPVATTHRLWAGLLADVLFGESDKSVSDILMTRLHIQGEWSIEFHFSNSEEKEVAVLHIPENLGPNPSEDVALLSLDMDQASVVQPTVVVGHVRLESEDAPRLAVWGIASLVRSKDGIDHGILVPMGVGSDISILAEKAEDFFADAVMAALERPDVESNTLGDDCNYFLARCLERAQRFHRLCVRFCGYVNPICLGGCAATLLIETGNCYGIYNWCVK